jgi:hypothetical protein
MARYFNTTGPCMPRLHYMLPPADRLIGATLDRYIRDELYWVLHAPRQTGKTTFLQSWMREINAGDEGIACYVSLERCQGEPETEKAMPVIIEAIRKHAVSFAIPLPECPNVSPGSMLSATLINWASIVAPKKLIVLFDEVDVVEGPALVSLLRQLRGGFAGRGVGKFPVSVALPAFRLPRSECADRSRLLRPSRQPRCRLGLAGRALSKREHLRAHQQATGSRCRLTIQIDSASGSCARKRLSTHSGDEVA